MYSINFKDLKTENIKCKHCSWEGKAEKAIMDEISDYGFVDLLCPECNKFVGILFGETSEDDAEQQIKEKEFEERLIKSQLKNTNQLPEINEQNIVFTSFEQQINEDIYIIINYKENEIWREIITGDYYHRFVEIGEIFLQKYKSNMIDFIPQANSYMLFVDCRHEYPATIKNFRKKLKRNSTLAMENKKQKELKEKFIAEMFEQNFVEKSTMDKLIKMPKGIKEYVAFEYELIKLSCIFNNYFDWDFVKQKFMKNDERKPIDIIEIKYKMTLEQEELETKKFYFDISDFFGRK